ncbi:MAG: septum formation protein Maf [Oscillospiraceae bacterium]|nr:septum formation protein Maf [Oscillospiraceae bacterium]
MLILASKSPRRRELLALYTEEFQIDVSSAAEPGFSGGAVSDYVEDLARRKARDVAVRHKGDTVIGADTVVAFGGEVLGKPRDLAHAREMLLSMSGGRQEVYTGVCVICRGEERCFSVCTTVIFRKLSEDEIDAYVQTGDCLDKAGAYGIQGGAGEFVETIEGDYFNVIGLPMNELSRVLEEILKTHSKW